MAHQLPKNASAYSRPTRPSVAAPQQNTTQHSTATKDNSTYPAHCVLAVDTPLPAGSVSAFCNSQPTQAQACGHSAARSATSTGRRSHFAVPTTLQPTPSATCYGFEQSPVNTKKSRAASMFFQGGSSTATASTPWHGETRLLCSATRSHVPAYNFEARSG